MGNKKSILYQNLFHLRRDSFREEGQSRELMSEASIGTYLVLFSSENNLVQPIESPRCDKQDVCSVHRHTVSSHLTRVPLGDIHDGTFQNFQQSLQESKQFNIHRITLRPEYNFTDTMIIISLVCSQPSTFSLELKGAHIGSR